MWGNKRLFLDLTFLFIVNFFGDCFSDENEAKLNITQQNGTTSQGEKIEAAVLNHTKAPFSHPLDPLSEAEINLTVSIIRENRTENVVFNYIALKEPDKTVLLPYFLQDLDPPVDIVPRRAFVMLISRDTGKVHEAIVNLNNKTVENWSYAPDGVQPLYSGDELDLGSWIAKNDSEVIKRCNELGWMDMNLVTADVWSIGYVGDRKEYQGKRLLQIFMYGKKFELDNEYCHPFDFLVVVDLNEERVINIEDLPTDNDFSAKNSTRNSVPQESSNFDQSLRDHSSFRKDLNPLNISQPNGPSFTLNGNELRWQNFKMRLGYNGREGLIIHNVNFNDSTGPQPKVRPLFYRMSLVEIFVPYGDSRPPLHRRHVFDAGQYGIGYSLIELEPQKDCIGEVRTLDTVFHDEQGIPWITSGAVCIFEEDAGLLWKHWDFRSDTSSLDRSQRLTILTIATFGSYDYIFSWHFYQDGTIHHNVKLSGVLITSLMAENAPHPEYGTTVFPRINGLYHQHFFTLRIDPEIDGNNNTVSVADVLPVPDPTGSKENPYGQGFTKKARYLRTVKEARTNVSPSSSRTWHIRNHNIMHPYTGHPIGWKLIPGPSAAMMMKQDSPIHKQAEWHDYSTWVTPYNEDQIFPGGFYLNNSGLAEWVRENPEASVDDTDIVIWHNFGISHIPRVEDFPVMPVESLDVLLKPRNFFNSNPALDVPPPKRLEERDEL